MIGAGELNKRVTLQRLVANSPDRDQGGSTDQSWSDLATVYAGINPLRGREFIAAQQINSEVTGSIKIRYRADLALTSKDRAKYGTRVYDILAVVDTNEEHSELLLYVKEGPNDGQ